MAWKHSTDQGGRGAQGRGRRTLFSAVGACIAAVLVTGQLVSGVALAADDLAAASVQGLSADESALLDLTNQDRAAAGLAPLGFAPELLSLARTRAASQIPGTTLNHYDASGQLAVLGLFDQAGLSYTLVGENLAAGTAGSTLERVNSVLMQSPSHRANILEPAFSAVAVGAAIDADGHVVYAEIFGAA